MRIVSLSPVRIVSIGRRALVKPRLRLTVVGISQVAAALTVIGGIVVVMWRKLEPWVTQLRVEQSCPSDTEWFKSLAERFEQRKAEKVPADLRHRDWAP
jgi:hypothetical protein